MLALILAAILALGVPCGLGAVGQEAPQAAAGVVRTFFSVRSAKPDAAVPAELTKSFEGYKGGPLSSLEYDLDGDGQAEKFVLYKGSGLARGNQWIVFSVKDNTLLGLLTGTMIFVIDGPDGGFPRLESYWRQGGDMAIVFEYAFTDGRYTRQASRSLSPVEISEYFRGKPPVDPDKELVKTERTGG